LNVLSYAPIVVGKFVEVVSPVKYVFPSESSARELEWAAHVRRVIQGVPGGRKSRDEDVKPAPVVRGVERARSHGEVVRRGFAHHIDETRGIDSDRIRRLPRESPTEEGRKDESAAGGVELRHEPIVPATVECAIEGIRGRRESARFCRTDKVDLSEVIHRDPETGIVQRTSEIGREGKVATRRIQFGDEGVQIAVEPPVDDPRSGGEVRGGGAPSHVGIPLVVHRKTPASIEGHPTQVGGEDQGIDGHGLRRIPIGAVEAHHALPARRVATREAGVALHGGRRCVSELAHFRDHTQRTALKGLDGQDTRVLDGEVLQRGAGSDENVVLHPPSVRAEDQVNPVV